MQVLVKQKAYHFSDERTSCIYRTANQFTAFVE